MLSRLQHWRSTRQRARIAAVQAVSELYYREGFVPRGTFRRLRRAELRRLQQRERPGPLAMTAWARGLAFTAAIARSPRTAAQR